MEQKTSNVAGYMASLARRVRIHLATHPGELLTVEQGRAWLSDQELSLLR